MRAYAFTVGMLALEALVVVHWVFLPGNRWLFAIAVIAGVAMCMLAALAVVFFLELLRRNPADPQDRRILAELRTVDGVWLLGNAGTLAFTAVAFHFGVYWVAVPLVLGLGADFASVLYGRLRTRTVPPAGQRA